MSEKVKRSFRNIFTRINKTAEESVSRQQMERLGVFAVDIVRKRTRLGYGVPVQLGAKQRLKALSQWYVERRKEFPDLSPTTSPKKSNLTYTGQLLESLGVIRAENGRMYFGPTGRRTDTNLSNMDVALEQQRQGRTFNRISELEFKQILREYRRNFGDLLRKRKLLQ